MSDNDKGDLTPEVKDETTVNKDEADKSLDEMDTAELKAAAEAKEATIKTLKAEAEENDTRQGQLRRNEKADAKIAKLNGTSEEDKSEKTDAAKGELGADDVYTLRDKGYTADSKEAEVLQKYKAAGMITDYQTGLVHPGVKAELEALSAETTAKTVVDNIDDEDDPNLITKKDVIAKFAATGEAPDDADQQEAIAADNLEKMGL